MRQLSLSFACAFFTLAALMSTPAFSYEKQAVLFHEGFDNLDNWKPLTFPKIKEHSQYSVQKNRAESYLRAESSASASAILHRKEFNVYEFPKIRWRWKISNVYEKGNAEKKDGDDYPIRIYVVFRYNPANASFGKRLKYSLAKTIYGEYPPHSSLNYIWANRKHEKRFLTNTYADDSKMVVLRTGPDEAGSWQEEEINILDDYRRAFGTDPPAVAGIAVMNDSDNTGESSVSYIDYIEVFK